MPEGWANHPSFKVTQDCTPGVPGSVENAPALTGETPPTGGQPATTERQRAGTQPSAPAASRHQIQP